ncbi:hypothetical protein CHUAL_010065 [Chamberlinius hualienensis]
MDGRHVMSTLTLLVTLIVSGMTAGPTQALDIGRLLRNRININKRADVADRCQPYEPFRCPGENDICISIAYLCDGAADCPDAYDEDPRLCTAAKRPPVEETANFLKSLLANHGPNYLEKLFGTKARDALAPLGGIQKVAVTLSESQTIEDFGKVLHLMRSDLEHLRNVFTAVENGDLARRGVSAKILMEYNSLDMCTICLTSFKR